MEAHEYEGHQSIPREPNSGITPRAIQSPVPLSDHQLLWWPAINKSGRPIAMRLRATAVRIQGALVPSILCASIELVVQRHESLRTQLIKVGDIPAQHIRSKATFHLATMDLSVASAADVEESAVRLAQEFFEQRIHISFAPPLDSLLLKLADDEHVLLLAVDHMACDGTSLAILTKEIWTEYDNLSTGRTANAAPRPLQYGDYSVWQHETRLEREEKHGMYWRTRAAGAPRVEIPRDFTCGSPDPLVGASLALPFGKILTDQLRYLAHRENVPLPIVVLTIYATVMSRFCDQPDWSMPFVYHGRHGRADLQNAIGFFAKALFFRVQLSESSHPLEKLKQVQLEFITAVSHQDYVPALPESCATDPLFNWHLVGFSKRWSIERQRTAVTGLRIQPFRLPQNGNVTFMPYFADTPSGVVATIKYHPELIARSTIERLGEEFRAFAGQMLK